MKTYLFCFFLIHNCFTITAVYPQQQIQGGVYFGGINYEGDLAPSSFIVSFSETHLDFGAFIYVKTNDWLGLKINYHHGTLSGTDANAQDGGRFNRNLSFRSPLDELSLSAAFFYASNHLKRHIVQPYLTLGVGIFRFNPQAKWDGQWYDLQPLSTEGQGLSGFADKQPYKKVQICLPIGSGFHINLGKRMALICEASLRKTFTDYLDDVSTSYVPLDDLRREKGEMAAILSNRMLSKDAQLHSLNQMGRGDPKNKDWYIIGSIGIVFNVLGKNSRDNFFKKKHNYLDCKQIFKKRK